MTQETDIFEDLRHRLISAGFGHGEKLRAEQLRETYGCSASTVREALFRLSTLGLVQFQEQRGFRVPEKSDAVRHQLTHLRVLLEAEGTAMSIRNGHIETRIHAAEDTAPLAEIWSRAEREFHQTLISACGSDVLKATHAQVYDRFRQQLMIEDLKFDYISNNIQHHEGAALAM